MARKRNNSRNTVARRSRKAKAPETITFTGVVTEIGAQGDGIVDGPKGPVFAPLTAPGDDGEFEAAGKRARLIRLERPGTDRREAPCVHYGDCGGCSLQHVSQEFYLDWKRNRVAETLGRVGVEATIDPLIETPVASRRRATIAWQKQGSEMRLGFNERRSKRIVEIPQCLVLRTEIKNALPRLRPMCATLNTAQFDLSITLCDNGVDLDFQGVDLDTLQAAMSPEFMDAVRAANVIRLSANGETALMIEAPVIDISGFRITPPPGGFLQASAEGQVTLIDLVASETGNARKIADLFCGVGAFALPLSKTATVYAADAEPRAIEALCRAHAGAQSSGMNIRPVTAEVRNLFDRPLAANDLNKFDLVVFDPPRAGAQEQAREIAASIVPRVIAVSCNPDTFARDAALLVAGGYQLSRVTPVDQFVYSAHVELVAVFDRA